MESTEVAMGRLLKNPEKLEKIRSIITYITYKVGGKYLSAAKLMKLYFMSELKSIESFQQRLSQAEFFNWDFGPWSLDVVLAADGVNDIEIVEEDVGKRYIPSLDKTTVNLTDKETQIIDNILSEWNFEQTSTLVERTKISPPFVWSNYGETIDFDRLILCYNQTYNDPELLDFIKQSKSDHDVTTLTNEEELATFVTNL